MKNFYFISRIQKTPFEPMKNQKSNINSIKMFGCSARVHIEKKSPVKIDMASEKGSVSNNSKDYLTGIPNDKEAISVENHGN